MGKRLETGKYQIFTFIRYSADALFYPFLMLYLVSQGYDNETCGYIVMMLPMVSAFINPIWMLFSKNINYNKHFISALTILEGLAVIVLLNVGASITWIIVAVLLISIFGQPIYTFIDGLTIAYTDEIGYEYTNIRIVGSIAYVALTAVSGTIISKAGYNVSFYIAASLFILTGIIVMSISKLKGKEGQESVNSKPDIKQLLKNKNLYWIMIFVALTIGVGYATDNYQGVYLKEIYRVEEWLYGIFFAVILIVEVITLFILSKIGDKIKTVYYLIFIAVINTVRYAVAAIPGCPLELIVVFWATRGIMIALYIHIIMRLLLKLFNIKNVTTAAVLVRSAFSFLQGIITIVGGVITKNPDHYWIIFTVAASLNLISLFFINYRSLAKNEEKEVKNTKILVENESK